MNEFLETAEFIEAAVQSVLGEIWEPAVPGMSGTYRHDGVGVYFHYSEEYLSWKSTVQASVELNPPLVETMAAINEGLPIGSVSLSEDIVIWRYKVLPRWIDTNSRGSANLLVDVLRNAPQMVKMCRERLEPHGGREYTPDNLSALLFL